MKVDIINELLEDFSSSISDDMVAGKDYVESFKWDVIANWQKHFSTEELDIGPSVELALENDYSGRLWGGEKFSIKSGILQLIQENPMYMKAAFLDLFNENFDISMRINRFVFHCDEVLEILHKKDERTNNHWQSDYSASLFLSLQMPEKYGLFQYDTFHAFLTKVENRNIPVEQDKERYFKIMNALHTVISKNTDFMNGFTYLIREKAYTGRSLFLINDFMEFSLKS